MHPALFDAAFHAAIAPERLALPFSFEGVRLERPGASTLRVSIVPSGEGAFTLRATDATGTPVLCVDSLATRPIDPAQLRAARATRPLYGLGWTEIAAAPGDASPRSATLGLRPGS